MYVRIKKFIVYNYKCSLDTRRSCLKLPSALVQPPSVFSTCEFSPLLAEVEHEEIAYR